MMRSKRSAGLAGACMAAAAATVLISINPSTQGEPDRSRAASPRSTEANLPAVEADQPGDCPAKFRPLLRVETRPVVLDASGGARGQGCGTLCDTEQRTYADSNFENGAVFNGTLPPGLVETEIGAVTYQLTAADFPICIESSEFIFAQTHNNPTTTEWSYYVWSGNPETGNLVAFFETDPDLGLLPIELPQPGGVRAVNLFLTVDPSDPEQIVINDDGSHQFSVGIGIKSHNQPPTTPCDCAFGFGTLPAVCCPPLVTANAWPAMDAAGPAAGTGANQWLWARDCPGGDEICFEGPGWLQLSEIPQQYVNDWAIRVTFRPDACAGACCLPGGCSDALDQSLCESQGGLFLGGGTTCAPGVCQGGCCYADSQGQQCSTVSPSQCAALGGEFAGFGTQCNVDVICEGACCVPFLEPGTECLDQFSQFDCEEIGAIYMGLSTTCAEVEPCFPLGGCCVGTQCSVEREMDCDASGGVWYGAETTCSLASLGACCFTSTESCSNLSAQNCCTFGGLYQGAGTNCTSFVCFPAGACCMPDGSCDDDVDEADCATAGGTFQGDGVLCSGVNCPQPLGACCASGGGCAELDEATCVGIPGATWQGPNTTCTPDPCAGVGACCASGGGCAELDQATCEGIPGAVFLGAGTDCSPDPCGPQTGACCNADGSCSASVLQADCEDCGGTYQGDGSSCAGANCSPACSADIVPAGGDGQVTISDVTSVLSAFGLPCDGCAQDVTPACGDDQVTISDVTFTLSAFGPCP